METPSPRLQIVIAHMLQSKFFVKIKKEAPKEEVAANARFLMRAGFVDKLMAGVYSYLPLGLRVVKKIENVIREEIETLGAAEILMPALHPKSIWEETGRWQKMEGILYKIKDSEGKEYGLGPTHEEIITDIVRKNIISYKDLPFALYQIQTKFRDEPRAKSGLLRGREFAMKDLYSFHSSGEDLAEYYEKAKKAYLKIFKRCGLDAFVVEASGGAFTKEYSHEFMVETTAGEDVTFLCPSCGFAQNKEIAKVSAGDKCPKCAKGKIEEAKTIEAGNIFKLGTKFSSDLKAHFTDKDGRQKPLVMGCYGIGVGRIMATAVEVHNDGKGIIWPKEIAPFSVHLLALFGKEKKETVKKEAEKIYETLLAKGIETLYDDREDKSAGEKFADADLIGIPLRAVVSERTLEKKSVEMKERGKEAAELVKISQILKYAR